MSNIIIIVAAAVVVVFFIIVAMRPPDFCVTRSTAIAAAPEVIFPHVNDLHDWASWSPWEKVNPAMQKTFEGPSAGTGAIYRWVGNNKVGAGSMTIMESRPNELVRLKLEFLKPFKATNAAEFTFKPERSQTIVTWSMSGKKNFMFKAFSMFMNMDKMVGSEFERGLAQMKSLIEAVANK